MDAVTQRPSRVRSGAARTRYTGRMDPLFDLTDKVAVITGGSRGIGKAIAFAYAEHGADVVIASRKLDNCAGRRRRDRREDRPPDARRRHPRRALGRVQRARRHGPREFGRCDILVNNAGMSPLYADVTDITEEYYDKVRA